MKTVFVVIAVFVGLCIIGGALAFFLTANSKKAATTFAEYFTKGKLDEAYAMTSIAFQKDYSKEKFDQFYTSQPDMFSQIIKINFNSVSTENGYAQASGYITSNKNMQAPVIIKMVKEQGQWKVYGFNFEFNAAVQK
jgi:hypothetical protein